MALAHRQRLMAAALGAAVVGTIPPARAQELETVVVTAQKREQSLQDVGISVAVLGSSQLEQLGASKKC